MKEYKVPIQSLIDHIKTAIDVDPWAKEMAEELLMNQVPKPPIPNYRSDGTIFKYECRMCRTKIFKNDAFCRRCGRPQIWT